MKTKKKRIAQEIQSRILTIVIAIFMVVAVVVAVYGWKCQLKCTEE